MNDMQTNMPTNQLQAKNADPIHHLHQRIEKGKEDQPNLPKLG
jgi:hypothetical protein